MFLFGCSSEAPSHVRRILVSTRPDTCVPRKHRCDLPQAATLQHRGGGVASSGHVLQAHGSECCSHMLHIFRYRLVVAARMQPVRPLADKRTNTARGRTTSRRNPSRVYGWQKRARKTKRRHSVLKTNHQSLHNSTRRPESTPRNCGPECCTQSSIVPNVQPRTQVISPGPVANGLTQCRPPAEAPPATPAAAYAGHASRSSFQQKHTPAEAHSRRNTLQQKKAPARGKNACVHTATGSDDRSCDHRNEPHVTLKLKLQPTAS